MKNVSPERVLSGEFGWIDEDHLRVLSSHPLDCVETSYPHYQHTVESAEGFEEPSERHPVFYGCFDWHSAVHSHWCLVRQLRLFPDHPRRDDIVESIERRLTPGRVRREVEYFEENPTFEKPYGWAWLLRLVAELSLWDDPLARTWTDRLDPLESTICSLIETEFLTQDRPFRVGTHGNSAFALAAILDYARTTGDPSLASATGQTTRQFYEGDESYPVEYEPLGWDFLSPALAEADLMRRVLSPGELRTWVDRFFPDLTRSPYRSILDPVEVDPQPEEEVATHLIGLNISKAWCLAGIAESLEDDQYGDRFASSARRHVEASLPGAFTDDYAGAHWLSSFVLYLVSRNEGGIADGDNSVE